VAERAAQSGDGNRTREELPDSGRGFIQRVAIASRDTQHDDRAIDLSFSQLAAPDENSF
jgi:hypothetical protein